MALRMGAFASHRNLRIALAAALALLAAVLAGCAKKSAGLDASYTTPEGTLDAVNAQLVMQNNDPVPILFFSDLDPRGAGPEDSLVAIESVQFGSASQRIGTIFDHTQASEYQVFRSEGGGGTRPIKNFTSTARRKWVDKQWEFYAFVDNDAVNATPLSYQGRGVISGATTPASPLTNPGVPSAAPLVNIFPELVTGNPTNPLEPYLDTAFPVKWLPVPGAAAYYLQVYQFLGSLRGDLERFATGAPQPLFLGKSRDLYVVRLLPSDLDVVSGGMVQHTLGSGRGTLFTNRTIFYGQEYLVRVSAVDATGRLIANTYGDVFEWNDSFYLDVLGFDIEADYAVSPSGGVIAAPSLTSGAPQRLQPAWPHQVPAPSRTFPSIPWTPDESSE